MELTQTPTKRQEIWRNASGQFGKAPEPIAEPVAEPTKKDDGVVVASTLLGSLTLLFGVVFWKVTLSIAAGGGIVYLAQKLIKERQSRAELVVNQGGTSTVLYL